jgi:hypothetical protein
MKMQWYYSNNATQMGPVAEAELRAMLASGKVNATDMVWQEGMKDWLPASSVPGLCVMPQVAGNPYQPPLVAGSIDAPIPTSGLAIASLICGIVGIVTCFLPGIAAVICGHMALKQMAVPNARVTGRGMAVAGLVLGYLSILLMVALGALIFMGAVFSKTTSFP